MAVTIVAVAFSISLLVIAAALPIRRVQAAAAAAALVLAGLTAWAPARGATASGSTLFDQPFANNTVDSTHPVSAPASPNGTNAACLTASGNGGGGPLVSCPANNDAPGSGRLRLTSPATSEEGGVLSATSVPTSEGIDATFDTYQYGGSKADGIAFVLAAVNPADPLSPATIGEPGGSLGYSAHGGATGLGDAYLGIGLDAYGNFSNSAYEGSGCTNPAYLNTSGGRVPGQVVVRGPGNGTTGYCALNSTATSPSSKALALRASTRAASVVPVEAAINPTSTSFTTASGITVAAGTYKVVFTPVGGSATTLSGTLPAVPSGLYPSSSWTTSSGIPKQLALGWVGSTGSYTDTHEVSAVNVVSAHPVPQLAVTQTSYTAAAPAPGSPVTYTVSPAVSASGADENSPVSVSLRLPAGVRPAGASGSGWTCPAPSGRVITCTSSSGPFAAGTSLPPLTVNGVVTASGITSAAVQSGTVVTASSSDGNPGYSSTAAAGTLPPAPSGITLSPASGTVAGGNPVTVSGSNISDATAIEIGTASQQQAGTAAVLLPCAPGATSGCFAASPDGTLIIPSMPTRTAAATAKVAVITRGVAGTATYAYTAVPGTAAGPAGGGLVIRASASAATADQGGTLKYTVRITNTGASAYSGAMYSIPLGDVLDDAVYNNDATATSGTVLADGQTLTWTGDLAAGAAATVTFSVTVDNPDTGNGTLRFTVTSPDTGTNCPASGTDPRCATSLPVSALTITQAASPASAAPGSVVHYTVTVTNRGLVPYPGATFTDSLTRVLDDAVYDGDAAATAGTVAYSSPDVTWTGSLAPGAKAVVTFSVTVNNPDTGDKVLSAAVTSPTAGSSCPAGGTDPACTGTATVLPPGVTVRTTPCTGNLKPGSTVHFTTVIADTAQVVYRGISVPYALSGVLVCASYNYDATATAGAVSFSDEVLTWTGNLTPGGTARVTFSGVVEGSSAAASTLANGAGAAAAAAAGAALG